MQDVYNNIDEYNPGRKYNVLIDLNDMIADTISNKKLNQIVTELFIKGRQQNISTVFITQSFSAVPKDVRLNCTHFFVRKVQTNESFNKLHLIIHQILTLILNLY